MSLDIEDKQIRAILKYWTDIISFGNYYDEQHFHNHNIPTRIEPVGFTYEIHNEEGIADKEARTYRIYDGEKIISKINIITDIKTKELKIGFFMIDTIVCNKEKWERFLKEIRAILTCIH